SLMAPAAERLAADLARVPFREPAFPVVANVTARPLPAAAAAPGLLAEQVTGSVRWVETLRWLAAEAGPDARFVELGAGEVLTGLIARTLPGAQAAAVEGPEGLEEVLSTHAGGRACRAGDRLETRQRPRGRCPPSRPRLTGGGGL